MGKEKKRTILMAEDDKDYYLLMAEAMAEAGVEATITWVEDGEQCLQYLKKTTASDGGQPKAPKPDLIFMDLNMPKKGGLETLRAIKADISLSRIPVVMLTISRASEDILMSYTLGATSFISKPLAFKHLVETARTIDKYWFKTVSLP